MRLLSSLKHFSLANNVRCCGLIVIFFKSQDKGALAGASGGGETVLTAMDAFIDEVFLMGGVPPSSYFFSSAMPDTSS